MRLFVLFAFTLFITTFEASSQIYFKPIPIGAYTANACNNTVVCHAFNMPQQGGWMQLADGTSNVIANIYDQDTVTNFCTTDAIPSMVIISNTLAQMATSARTS